MHRSEFSLVSSKLLDKELEAVNEEVVIVFDCEDGAVSDVADEVLEERSYNHIDNIGDRHLKALDLASRLVESLVLLAASDVLLGS